MRHGCHGLQVGLADGVRHSLLTTFLFRGARLDIDAICRDEGLPRSKGDRAATHGLAPGGRAAQAQARCPASRGGAGLGGRQLLA